MDSSALKQVSLGMNCFESVCIKVAAEGWLIPLISIIGLPCKSLGRHILIGDEEASKANEQYTSISATTITASVHCSLYS